MSKYKYVAEIPARIGSQRIKQKNLRLIDGKPMIAYSIEACKNTNKIDKIFVNTDNDKIGQVAYDYDVEFYRRDSKLCCNNTKQDEFNYDFLLNVDCEYLVMVNPVAPLVESFDIENAINYFEENNFDSLITVKNEQLHSFYQNEALNFEKNELLPATQDIDPVQICTWTICIWKKESFLKAYERDGYAAFNGNLGLWVIDPIKAIKVSYEEDFIMAELLIKARGISKNEVKEIKYYGES
jgi:CMP-N,N'-diacetyllegionaminic acid synthase